MYRVDGSSYYLDYNYNELGSEEMVAAGFVHPFFLDRGLRCSYSLAALWTRLIASHLCSERINLYARYPLFQYSVFAAVSKLGGG